MNESIMPFRERMNARTVEDVANIKKRKDFTVDSRVVASVEDIKKQIKKRKSFFNSIDTNNEMVPAGPYYEYTHKEYNCKFFGRIFPYKIRFKWLDFPTDDQIKKDLGFYYRFE